MNTNKHLGTPRRYNGADGPVWRTITKCGKTLSRINGDTNDPDKVTCPACLRAIERTQQTLKDVLG